MGSEIVAFESQLRPLSTHFEQALAGVMPVDRLIRTALISAERNPSLLQCDRQSFLNTIMSAGVLGLEMDGVTGQCFPVPFARKVQLIIGYKGYNTLAARAGLTITGEVVRDGDAFDYLLGTGAFVKHKPKLGNQGRIIGAWAQAAANNRPPIVAVLGIDELMAIKNTSPGGKKADSPWNNAPIGFPAMCSKSVKRRLCRSTPLNVTQLAARMEEAFEEQGRHSFIAPNGQLVIEGESPIAQTERNETPTMTALTAPKDDAERAEILKDLVTAAEVVAKGGTDDLRKFWENTLSGEEKHLLAPDKDRLKRAAEEADRTI